MGGEEFQEKGMNARRFPIITEFSELRPLPRAEGEEVSSRRRKEGFHRAHGEGNLRQRAGWGRRVAIGGPEAGGFPSAGQDRLDFESGVCDFAGGDSEAGRDLHLGNRQGHSKNGKTKVIGVRFQLRPPSYMQSRNWIIQDVP